MLLPLLSRQVRAGDVDAGMASLNRAVEFTLLLTLPAAAALVVIPGPIITVLFERGAFGAADSAAAADALIAFALGVPAFVLVKVLAPGFFAREDVVTPIKVAAVSVAANIVLSVILLRPLEHVGLALATSTASWINAILLWLILTRRGHFRIDARLRNRVARMTLATIGMAGLLAACRAGMDGMILAGGLERAAALVLLVLAGIAGYGALAVLTGAAGLGEMRRTVSRRRA